jgi:hypothetical protein
VNFRLFQLLYLTWNGISTNPVDVGSVYRSFDMIHMNPQIFPVTTIPRSASGSPGTVFTAFQVSPDGELGLVLVAEHAASGADHGTDILKARVGLTRAALDIEFVIAGVAANGERRDDDLGKAIGGLADTKCPRRAFRQVRLNCDYTGLASRTNTCKGRGRSG